MINERDGYKIGDLLIVTPDIMAEEGKVPTEVFEIVEFPEHMGEHAVILKGYESWGAQRLQFFQIATIAEVLLLRQKGYINPRYIKP